MGVWTIGTGSILVESQVEEILVKEYAQFSNSCFPAKFA